MFVTSYCWLLDKILETYSLEDILEYNDKTVEECLQFLLDLEYIELPEVLPVDLWNTLLIKLNDG